MVDGRSAGESECSEEATARSADGPGPGGMAERFTADERRVLSPHFTNLDGDVFALRNLPEVVKGALFARYSRSSKSLRRLFLDEFVDVLAPGRPVNTANGGEQPDSLGEELVLPGFEGPQPAVGAERAARLYARVFGDYGDDSVAQLGAAHIACEGVSNVLTKVLERGRLASYLEQSTRYVPYTDRPGGRWKYVVPEELDEPSLRGLRERYVSTLDDAFMTYCRWLEPAQAHFRRRYPNVAGDSDAVYRAVIRAKALDTLRGLLPAATRSNVGIFASGQAFEALLLRMRVHPLAEARACADRMLTELRVVIPAFVARVDREDRGVRWSRYLAGRRRETAAAVERILRGTVPVPQPEVALVDFDPDGEVKVVAAALYESSRLPESQLLETARGMSADDRTAVLSAYVGDRANRRHRPGRAFERTGYCFDVLSDYGAFRDLQRHRLLTVEWQALSADHGYVQPAAVEDIGAEADWRRVMDRTRELHAALVREVSSTVAQYAVPMAYRIRYRMQMNAREAMHVIELRTAPQGHPAYRRVCQAMHRAIRDEAGHAALAEAMRFADHSAVALERLAGERASERRRAERGPAGDADQSSDFGAQ